MHKYTFTTILLISSLLVSSCFADHNTSQFNAASCPISAPMGVLKASYNEAQGQYLIFHTTPPGAPKIANPLIVENLQMAQISPPPGSSGESARLNFQLNSGQCNPVLEMTQGYKIELATAASEKSLNAGQSGGAASSGGSSWAPFLMGALVGNAVSNALQPRMLAPPAYYLPPPSGTPATNGVITGGVSGKTPDETSKKYESKYNQSPKSGFFSKRNSAASSMNQDRSATKKKSGFFSGNRSSSGGSRGSFFKKR